MNTNSENIDLPWTIDKPLEEIKNWLGEESLFKIISGDNTSWTIVQYLLTRINFVEEQRDTWKNLYQEIKLRLENFKARE